MKWPIVGRLLSSRWCLGALAVIAGALGFTLLSWLFTPSSAAAAQLQPAIPVPALAVPGVATVTLAQPTVAVSSPLVAVSVQAPAASPAVPLLGTAHSASKTVPRLRLVAGVATQLRELTTLVDSVTGVVAGEIAPKAAPRGAAPPSANRRVGSPVRHRIGSARIASSDASTNYPIRTVPVSAEPRTTSPVRGPAVPGPSPLSSSCVGGGHGGSLAVAILGAADRTGPFVGPVWFAADQLGGDDSAVRPGVTPD